MNKHHMLGSIDFTAALASISYIFTYSTDIIKIEIVVSYIHYYNAGERYSYQVADITELYL